MSRRENPNGNRRIAWQNVLTVFSAAILIGAEVFGAAFAGGWAVASYLDLGPLFNDALIGVALGLAGWAVVTSYLNLESYLNALIGVVLGLAGLGVAYYLDWGSHGVMTLQGVFFLAGIAVLAAFIRNAQRVEPFTTRG